MKTAYPLVRILHAGGLTLLVFAYPLAFGLLQYYDYAIMHILMRLNVMVELRLLFALPVAAMIGVIGNALWRPQLRPPRPAAQESDGSAVGGPQVRVRLAARVLILLLMVVSMFATLLVLVYACLLVIIAVALSDYPVSDSDKLWLTLFVLANAASALSEFAVAFLAGRFQWRRLQSRQASGAAQDNPHHITDRQCLLKESATHCGDPDESLFVMCRHRTFYDQSTAKELHNQVKFR